MGWVIYSIFLYGIFPIWLFVGFELLPIEKGTNNEIFMEMIKVTMFNSKILKFFEIHRFR